MPAAILIVDDEPAIRDAIAMLLGEEGFRVHTAWDGREALELLRRSHPDVIVSDVMMPVMNGYELVEELRAHNDLTPVILMSAGSHPLSGKPNVVSLSKPFDLDHLLTLVAELLGRR